MEIHFEDLSLRTLGNSFYSHSYEQDGIPFHLHYHPEYEIVYMEEGHGQRLIGNSLNHYSKGDMVMIAPNVLHTWSSTDSLNRAFVIQFSRKFISHFLDIKEFETIRSFLNNFNGAYFYKSKKTADAIKKLMSSEGTRKIIYLLEILDSLSSLPSQKISHSNPYYSRETENRINKVCSFIHQNFHRQIDVLEVASLIHLSKSAFCKFFKNATNKTFTEYVNFIRIEVICNELLYSDQPIYQIIHQNGFENQTYFNRIFKKVKKCTPLQFRIMLKQSNK